MYNNPNVLWYTLINLFELYDKFVIVTLGEFLFLKLLVVKIQEVRRRLEIPTECRVFKICRIKKTRVHRESNNRGSVIQINCKLLHYPCSSL